MIMHTRQLRTRTCRRATRHFFIPYEAFSCSSSHSSAGNTFLGKREREMLGLGPMLARREAAGGRRMWLPCLLPQSSLGEVVGRGRSVGRSRRPKTPLARSRSGDEQFILYLISSDRSRRRRRLARECLPACLCLCDGTVWLERGRGEKWEVGERGRRGLAAALTHSGRSR